MFLLVFGGHRCPSDGHQHGVSIQISKNLRKTEVSPHILQKKNCCDLNLGESLCIVTIFLFSDSGLHLLNSFDFYSEWRDTESKTSNFGCLGHFDGYHRCGEMAVVKRIK